MNPLNMFKKRWKRNNQKRGTNATVESAAAPRGPGRKSIVDDSGLSTDEEDDEDDDWKADLGMLVQNNVGNFRQEDSRSSLSGVVNRRRSSTAGGARRSSLSAGADGAAIVGDSGGGGRLSFFGMAGENTRTNTDDIVRAAIADCTQKPFIAQGSLMRLVHSTGERDSEITAEEVDDKKWKLRWVEVRGPFVMQWQSESASKIEGPSPKSHGVTMPESAVDLRTVSECGMYFGRILFFKFKDRNTPEVLFRPAQQKWLSEFHFWQEAFELVMAEYAHDPDVESIVNSAGEMTVDVENNPPPPAPPPLPSRLVASSGGGDGASASPAKAEPGNLPTAQVVSKGAPHGASEEDYDDCVDAQPGCFACGFFISAAPTAEAAASPRPRGRSSFFAGGTPRPIADAESNPQAWLLEGLPRNTVDILVHSLVTDNPLYEQDRKFRVEVTLMASGGGPNFFGKTNNTSFNESYRFSRNSRVAWPTVAEVIELHFEVIETVDWIGDVEIALAQLSFDTSKEKWKAPFEHTELIDFYGIHDGQKLNMALRADIAVGPTEPISTEVEPPEVVPPAAKPAVVALPEAPSGSTGGEEQQPAESTTGFLGWFGGGSAQQEEPKKNHHHHHEGNESEYSYDTD